MELDNSNIVYLLGAGFSHAITPDNKAPLTKRLGELLGEIFPAPIKQKYGFSPDKIELFLTKIDLALQEEIKDKKLEAHRKEVTKKICEIFDLSNLCNITENGTEISAVASNVTNLLFKRNDVILTLNYDCYLENVLMLKKKWSPDEGYGVFGFKDDNENSKLLNIKFYKLHGSTNFILHGLLTENGKYDRSELWVDYKANDKFFPGGHMHFGWTDECQEGYVVSPSYLKQFEYKSMLWVWKKAAHKLQTASKLIIIGTSLREEDYPLHFLLSFLNGHAKTIVIDEAAELIKKKLIKSVAINTRNIVTISTKIENITYEMASKIYDE